MLRTDRAGKGPGGCGGGLRLKEQKGPRFAPPSPGLRGWGTSQGSPAIFLGSVGWGSCPLLLALSSRRAPPACLSFSPLGLLPMPPRTHETWRGLWRAGDRPGSSAGCLGPQWVGQSPSTSLLSLLDGSSRLPLLISPASLLCPQDPHGLVGALEAGYWLESSAGSPAQVGQAITLCSSPSLPRESLPPASPDLPPWPQGRKSCLASTSSPPSVPLLPTGSLWGSCYLLGCQRSPPAAGRHTSCGEKLTLCLPTPPS